MPVLYIETVKHTPVTQKEEYVEAHGWLDASMTDEFESLGSPDEPVGLGIRGRGNSSWSIYEKKPYKIKFDNKQSLLGNPKSKHFALLHYLGAYTSYYSETVGLEIGRRLGLEWTPNVQPVEVVLNGEYIGLYFLAETVRVEKTRVNITDQPDLNMDPMTVSQGWLVEIDNYNDPNQVVMKEPDGRTLKLTFKSPEVLSDMQRDYIVGQFSDMMAAVHDSDKSSTRWLDYIDVESCVKTYIVHELVHNYDAFNGSFFMHKDAGDKWFFGPLWDLCYGLDKTKTQSVLEDFGPYANPKLIREIVKFPYFTEELVRIWREFRSNGTDWIADYISAWESKIAAAAAVDAVRWPQYNKGGLAGRAGSAARLFAGNVAWMDDFVADKAAAASLTPSLAPDFDVMIDGLTVTVTKPDRDMPVSVYDLGGSLVLSTRSMEFSLPTSGFYVIRCGDRCRKICC
ncbi:MAG: CotH kinase family protein [Muribaculaceae bacterium]|nr:CotH kinase family protein [Muribaculaceae bacterium]